MFKFCLLLAAASAINMVESSNNAECIKNKSDEMCHFKDTDKICACPPDPTNWVN